MKTTKRFLAKLLVFATVFSAVDLSWLDLSEPLKVLAAEATDAYKAYDNLKDSLEWSNDLKNKMNLDTNAVAEDTRADASVSNFSVGSDIAVTDGIYTFNQRNIKATAQVKSGSWLNNTEYDAMTGTPTTEPIFVTAGGTQWIVDLQYRYISAPYERTYTFRTLKTPNYRYYKMNDAVYKDDVTSEVSYVAQVSVPYDKNPKDYSKYTTGPKYVVESCNEIEGPELYNFAYKFFELSDAQISDNNYTSDIEKEVINFPNYVEGTGTIAVTCNKADDWGNTSNPESVAPLNKTVASATATVGNENPGVTSYVTPNVAKAVLAKQHVAAMIEELKAMWMTQVDNYRADQGYYDVTANSLDSGRDIPDELSFMYTYSGMVRHTNIRYEGGYKPATLNSPKPLYNGGPSGDELGASIWTPVFTSYYYDWNSYYLEDNMLPTFGSDTPTLNTLKDLDFTDSQIRDMLCKFCEKDENSSANWVEDPYAAFAMILDVHPTVSAFYGNEAFFDEDAYTQNRADLYFARQSYLAPSVSDGNVNKNTIIALSDFDNLLAFSAKFHNSSPDMCITDEEVSNYNVFNKAQFDYKHEGTLEITYLYYRAIYTLLLNYGGWFYYNEARELFKGVPGFPLDVTDVNKYNRAVNCNLASVFGQGAVLHEFCTVKIPFAIFPFGGDLDGGMSSFTSRDFSTVGELNRGVDIIKTQLPGICEPAYIYYVSLELEISNTKDYAMQYLGVSDEGTEYAIEKHADGSTDDYPICEHEEIDNGTCEKGDDCIDGETVVCEDCSDGTCSGDWKGSAGAWECKTCGAKSSAVGVPGSHSCNTCGGDGEVDSEHSVETHTHYSVAAHNSEPNATVANHVDRVYKETLDIVVEHSVNNNVNDLGTYGSDWDTTTPYMEDCQTLTQSFDNVRWLDITSYTLWQINNASVKGLSALLIKPITVSDVNANAFGTDIVTKAVDTLGYTCYNVNDDTYLKKFGSMLSTSTGHNDKTYYTNYGTLTGLQKHGRIANALYPGSFGNVSHGANYVLGKPGTDTVLAERYLIYYSKSDTPYIRLGLSVNDNTSTYTLLKVSNDNLIFQYNPMAQGGRSHTTFNGFVSQALANTLYYKYLVGNLASHNNYNAAGPAIAYGNSLLIQSDYLTLDYSDGTSTALAGAYYDTWGERGTEYELSAGKFALVPPGFNDLSIYASTCRWIPARLSTIFSRGSKDEIYACDGKVTNDTDCWIIHTYCQGINGDKHSIWDSIYDANKQFGTTLNCGCSHGVHHATDKGNVNTQESGDEKPRVIHYLKNNYKEELYHVQKGVIERTIDTQNVVKLAVLLANNHEYYEQFKNKLGATGSVEKISDNKAVIHIPMEDYLSEGTNTSSISTMAMNNTFRSGLPYVGYQSQGVDDKDIAVNVGSSTDLQDGYTYSAKTDFDTSKSFIEIGNHKSFGNFGLTLSDYTDNLTVVESVDNTQTTPENANTFSQYYPYLFNLNLNRYLPNNIYRTGATDVNYSIVGKLENEVSSYDVPSKHYDSYDNNNPITLNAPFLKSDSNTGKTNKIVIYNPVSTESAHIVALSEFLPDAANNGSTAYLQSFNDLVKRDTRLGYKYDFDNLGTNEQYLTGTGINSVASKVTTEHYYEMLPSSNIATKYYTMDDYVVGNGATEPWTTSESSGERYEVSRAGKYNMTKQDGTGNFASASIYLNKGDQIYLSPNAKAVCLRPVKDYILDWESLEDSYKSLQEHTDNQVVKDYPVSSMSVGFPLFTGMSLAVGTGSIQLSSGTLLKLQLTVSNNSEDGHLAIDNALEIENTIPNVNVTATGTEATDDGSQTTYTWYLEAKTDTVLTSVPIKVTDNCFLWYGENLLQTESIVLFNLSAQGAAYDGVVSSYDFFYNSNCGYGEQQQSSKTFYNKYAVAPRVDNSIVGVDLSNFSGFAMGLASDSASISLSNEALSDPHKVPNTNWRYYVLGWSTTDGHVITSVSDSVLNSATTKLRVPSGTKYFSDGFVTVEYLNSAANTNSLGIYRTEDGAFGLIDLNSNGEAGVDYNGTWTPRESRYTGYKMTSGTYSVISFGPNTQPTYGTAMPKGNDNGVYGNTEISRHSYEEIYYATESDGLAYDVKYSQNTLHKISVDSESFDAETGNGKDWKKVVKQIPTFDENGYAAVFGDTLSLDDEFTIYWDNFGNLSNAASTRKYTSTSKAIGYGWDNGNDSNDDLPVSVACNFGNGDTTVWDTVKSYPFWSNYMPGNSYDVTDTTKWIYEKYLVFNIDMYAFTSGDSFVYDDANGDTQGSNNWNPTTPAYKSDGTPNNIVYIPAGEKVYLGYYDRATDSAGNDSGKFVDYGYKSNTSQATVNPNGELYTYHFWCPLSNGEADSVGNVQFVVNAINAVNDNNFTINHKVVMSGNSLPTPVAITRGITDEWGNTIVNLGGICLNNNANVLSSVTKASTNLATICKNTYGKYNGALNSASFSILGRVGGLTVVDSGDPRYQDTFKKAATDAEFAISPIVRLISKFSNKSGAVGSQEAFLSDLADVRGRLLTTNSSYKTASSGNSYANASWYESNVGLRSFLPMNYTFNKHEELKDTVTTSKLGYELYCSLKTIGNFYGSAEARPEQSDGDYVNNNLDYGQTKVQIHPMYVAIPKNGDTPFAVDVYMRKGSNYALINAGSKYASEEAADGSGDSGPYYLDDAFDATYTSSISTNSAGIGNNTYKLDQNMLRRSVTDVEAKVTYDILSRSKSNVSNAISAGETPATWAMGITTSLLDSDTSFDNDDGELGGTGLDYSYIYGNAQMLFLREHNRTFIGGTTLALNEQSANSGFAATVQSNAELYAQKWHFGLGLPASAVFVKHGSNCNESNILSDDYFILCLIDVYAIGEKWALHYQSPASQQVAIIGGREYNSDVWNVYYDVMPQAIPVCIYDLSKITAAGDKDSHGSH